MQPRYKRQNFSVLTLCPRSLCPPVTLSPGHFVSQSLCPQVTLSPGHFVPSHFVPGHFVPGHFAPGHFVPGHFVPGHFVPQSLCTPDHFVPRSFCPPVILSYDHFVHRSLCPPVTLSPVSFCLCGGRKTKEKKGRKRRCWLSPLVKHISVADSDQILFFPQD
jgi:hypothetical protein